MTHKPASFIKFNIIYNQKYSILCTLDIINLSSMIYVLPTNNNLAMQVDLSLLKLDLTSTHNKTNNIYKTKIAIESICIIIE